ncbi:Na/Pi cotransporter family protein [Enterococcus sp. HY326]|uniref:Na/Pi cotransporter family protein n=1 Tax=Enterococcus sp. HY326 TaxID=2971265 RepID=UPI0022404356|nr:Na/Pi cotransporter family protein [Enterococcus sp. HY326]
MSFQEMLFTFLGGLGIFLFGIKYMGDGLQKAAGDRLKEVLNRFTSTPLRAVLAGIIVTGLIQSSSGTTVLTVGLVSAGFMSLKQAIGVIMGANVGTTVTAFIIGFNLSAYSLPIIGIGALLLFFTKREVLHNAGQILFGFGCLFFGLTLMGDAMEPLKDLPQFEELMINVSHHPILGVGIGTLLTMILQSSSATIGILQQLYTQNSLSLQAALPILFGDNIGTTITAVLAAIGTSIAAKRTAASHVIFNLVGAIIFTLLLGPFTSILIRITDIFGLNPAMQIAVAHGMFNLANLCLQIWFINQIATIVQKIIPGKEKNLDIRPIQLAENLIYTAPSLAIEQARIELQNMGDYVLAAFQAAETYYQQQNPEQQQDLLQYEDAINHLDTELTLYLAKLATVELTIKESHDQTMLLEIAKDMERVGDHSKNIIELLEDAATIEKKQRSKDKRQKKADLRNDLILQDQDIFTFFATVKKNLSSALSLLHEDNEQLAHEMMDREEQVNLMVEELRAKYIQLMTTGQGRPSDGVLFIDISSNLERCSDLSVHIAKYALDKRY